MNITPILIYLILTIVWNIYVFTLWGSSNLLNQTIKVSIMLLVLFGCALALIETGWLVRVGGA